MFASGRKMREPQLVKLTTLHFYDAGAVPPREIALRDCSLLNKPSIPGVFTALYGYNGQRNIAAMKTYAAANRLAFIIINVEVKLDYRQDPQMTCDDLPHHDFVSLLDSASISLRNEFGEMLRQILDSGKWAQQMGHANDDAFNNLFKPRSKSNFAREFARDVLMARPELISAVMDSPACRHLKAIAFRAKSHLSGSPLQIAAVPFRHWNCIRKATCLMPNINVSLENPFVDDCSANKFTPPPPPDIPTNVCG